MNQNKVDLISDEINSLSYEEKLKVYTKCFSIGNFLSKHVNERLILLSLLSLTYFKLKEKDKNIKPVDVLIKITNGKKDDTFFYQMLESLSILVEDFGYNCNKADSCGLKNSQEIINKIKEILNTWIPF